MIASTKIMGLVLVGGGVLSMASLSMARPQIQAKSDPTTTVRPGSEADGVGVEVGSGGSGFGPRGAPCAANAGNCQELTGVAIADPRTSDVVGGAFTVKDNFQPSASGSITSICFTGFYGPGMPAGANVPVANNESFRITIWENNGTGLPAQDGIVAQIFVGANAAPALGAPGYVGTLTRGTSLGQPTNAALINYTTQLYAWTVTGLSIPVTAGTCYWIEIVGATAGEDTSSRWRWVNSTHATGVGSYADGVTLQTAANAAPTYSSIVNGFDRAFCVSIGAASNVLAVPDCGVPAVPTNNSCATAINITTLPYNSPANTGTYRSSTELTPYCGLNPVNGNTLWYKVTGNGTTLTANTCGAETNFDTIINVYCLSGQTTCGTANANLLCVANNDAGPVACVGDGGANTDPSQVSWTATNGTVYYIAVYGYFAANAPVGAVALQVASDGLQATPVVCVTDRCPIDLATITGAIETDACAADTNNACNAVSVQTFALGTWLKGTIQANAPAAGAPGNGRDIDYWEYNTAVPLPDNSGGGGQTNLTATWRAEAPILLGFYTGACTANGPGTNLAAFVGRYRPSLNGMASNGVCGPLATTIVTNSGANLRVLVTSPDYGGVPCATGWNNYAVKVELAATGACCITGVACTVTTSGQCVTNGGTYTADNATCASLPCPGACCTNGNCTSVANAAACGGLYQGESTTCALTSCPQPNGVCCRGATCNALLVEPNCTAAGGLAGAYFAPGPNCTGSTIAGCCHADYNKINGIEIQDIFDFLNDWLNGSQYAIVGGTGSGGTLDVQNIFDFLNVWFVGCTP